MFGLSLPIIGQFIASVILQVIAISALPMTAGFTKIGPTLACIIGFAVAIGLLARIAASGVQLSILIPLSAAAVPIAVVLVSIFFYGEPAPILRVAMLIGACALVGVASTL
jgi:small multidrug resistance pump